MTKCWYLIETSATFGPGDVLPPSSSTTSKQDVDVPSGIASEKQLQPLVASTDSPKPIYISFGQTGYVLTFQQSDRPSGVVTEHKGERGDEQKWTIEYGDTPDIIALRNVTSGKYLYCYEAKHGGKVGMGEKQWWKITVVKYSPPGGCRLAPVGGGAYLSSSDRGVSQGASSTASNQVNMTTSVSVSSR